MVTLSGHQYCSIPLFNELLKDQPFRDYLIGSCLGVRLDKVVVTVDLVNNNCATQFAWNPYIPKPEPEPVDRIVTEVDIASAQTHVQYDDENKPDDL